MPDKPVSLRQEHLQAEGHHFHVCGQSDNDARIEEGDVPGLQGYGQGPRRTLEHERYQPNP